MSYENWVTRTGQKWKIVPGIIGVVLGFVALAGLIHSSSNPEAVLFGVRGDSLIISFAFMLVSMGGAAFGWFVFAISCPTCGARPVWRLMTGEQSFQWYFRLLTLEECPACGATGNRTL